MIDFAVIGAQKAGTVSLRSWLLSHPEVACAPHEYPVFAAGLFQHGGVLDLRRALDLARDSSTRTAGVVTPQYSMGHFSKAAQRLHGVNPVMKIVLLRRDRIDRAYSAWAMHARNGQEPNTFDEAIANCLAGDLHALSDLNSYVRAGYYNAIEREYRRFFSDVFVGEIDDLAFPRALCEFLGIAPFGVPLPYVHRGSDSLPKPSMLVRYVLRQHYSDVGEV